MDPSEEVRVTLGRKIKELRMEKNLSQSYLADITDLHRSYLSSLENGNKNVTLDILVKLALSLNVSLPELFEKPRNLPDQVKNNSYTTALFAAAGLFSTISTLSSIPTFGLGKYAFKKLNNNLKLLKNYIDRNRDIKGESENENEEKS